MNDDIFSITVPITFDKHEFLSSILGSAYETWYWWKEDTFDEGYSWNKYPDDNNKPFLTVGILDPNGDDEEKVITKRLCVNDITKGYATAHAKGYKTRLDDLDAVYGDAIMQFVVLGECVYGV